MGLSCLDDPNCDTDRHKAPIWAEKLCMHKKKTITTRCRKCESIIEVQYKPTIIIKQIDRGYWVGDK